MFRKGMYSRAQRGRSPAENPKPASTSRCAYACGGRGGHPRPPSLVESERERERESGNAPQASKQASKQRVEEEITPTKATSAHACAGDCLSSGRVEEGREREGSPPCPQVK